MMSSKNLPVWAMPKIDSLEAYSASLTMNYFVQHTREYMG